MGKIGNKMSYRTFHQIISQSMDFHQQKIFIEPNALDLF